MITSEGKYQKVSVMQIFNGSIIEISFDETLNLNEGHRLLLEFD